MLSGGRDLKRKKRNSNVFWLKLNWEDEEAVHKSFKKQTTPKQQWPELFESENKGESIPSTNRRKIETSQNPIAER